MIVVPAFIVGSGLRVTPGAFYFEGFIKWMNVHVDRIPVKRKTA
jgi:hypothetical protein